MADRYAFTVSEIFTDGRVLVFAYEREGLSYHAVMVVSLDKTCRDWVTLLDVSGRLVEKHANR